MVLEMELWFKKLILIALAVLRANDCSSSCNGDNIFMSVWEKKKEEYFDSKEVAYPERPDYQA